MNKVWVVRHSSYDHCSDEYICATEELALEYLKIIAEGEEINMANQREYVLSDRYPGSEVRRQSQSEKWVVTWDSHDRFHTPTNQYYIECVDIVDHAPTDEVRNRYSWDE